MITETKQIATETKQLEISKKKEFIFEINAALMRKVVNSLTCFQDECIFSITADGIFFLQVCPAHVSMVKMLLSKQDMIRYPYENDMEFGVDLESLSKFLSKSMYSNEQVLVMFFEENKTHLNQGDYRETSSTLKIEDFNRPKFPTIHKNGEFDIFPLREFIYGVEFTSEISDHTVLKLMKDTRHLFLISEWEDVRRHFDVSGNMVGSVVCEGNPKRPDHVRTIIPSEYLLYLFKNLPSEENAKIFIDNDYPIRIEQNFGKASTVTYLCAPRIESED